jgi:hypothetical protein
MIKIETNLIFVNLIVSMTKRRDITKPKVGGKRIFRLWPEGIGILVLVLSIYWYNTNTNNTNNVIQVFTPPAAKFLPDNFTFFGETSFYTAEVLDLLRDYPLDQDDIYKGKMRKEAALIAQAENFSAQQWRYKLEIRPVPGKGNGCFALQDIPANSIVGEYIGIVTTEEIDDYAYSWDFIPGDSDWVDSPLGDISLDSKYHGDGWMR